MWLWAKEGEGGAKRLVPWFILCLFYTEKQVGGFSTGCFFLIDDHEYGIAWVFFYWPNAWVASTWNLGTLSSPSGETWAPGRFGLGPQTRRQSQTVSAKKWTCEKTNIHTFRSFVFPPEECIVGRRWRPSSPGTHSTGGQTQSSWWSSPTTRCWQIAWEKFRPSTRQTSPSSPSSSSPAFQGPASFWNLIESLHNLLLSTFSRRSFSVVLWPFSSGFSYCATLSSPFRTHL